MNDIKTSPNTHNPSIAKSESTDQDILYFSTAGMTKYNGYYTTSRLNMTIHPGGPSTPATYYLETSCCSLKGLMIYLRRGPAKSSPMVAFAKLPWTSRHMELGKGDYHNDSADTIAWEKLHRDRNCFVRSDYHFSTSAGDEMGKRKEFAWRKDKSKSCRTVYECVDQEGMVVAKMARGGGLNWKKGAEIEVMEGVEEGLKEMLMCSALAIWGLESLNYRSLLQGYSSNSEEKE